MMYKIAKSEGSAIGDFIVDTATSVVGKTIRGTTKFLKWLTQPVSRRINPLYLLAIGAIPLTTAYLITTAGKKARGTLHSEGKTGIKYVPGYSSLERGDVQRIM
ncbi:MAG: hypothetical protein ABIM30_00315 [candidate division WOR-3 bacterium]